MENNDGHGSWQGFSFKENSIPASEENKHYKYETTSQMLAEI